MTAFDPLVFAFFEISGFFCRFFRNFLELVGISRLFSEFFGIFRDFSGFLGILWNFSVPRRSHNHLLAVFHDFFPLILTDWPIRAVHRQPNQTDQLRWIR